MPASRRRGVPTVARLVTAARRLFASHGYEATSLDDVVGAAGVTKGALYHHYSGSRRSFARCTSRSSGTSRRPSGICLPSRGRPLEGPLRRLPGVPRGVARSRGPPHHAPRCAGRAGVGPDARDRRGLLNVPARARARDRDHFGADRPRPVRPLAHLLFGAICEGAMMAARSGRSATRNRGRPSRALPHARRHDPRLEAVIVSRRPVIATGAKRSARSSHRFQRPPLRVCEVSSAS
jgi:AcrR family transcriptional regulator